jgi:hypothetical protein
MEDVNNNPEWLQHVTAQHGVGARVGIYYYGAEHTGARVAHLFTMLWYVAFGYFAVVFHFYLTETWFNCFSVSVRVVRDGETNVLIFIL